MFVFLVWLNNESYTVLSELPVSSGSSESSSESDSLEESTKLSLEQPKSKRRKIKASKKEKDLLLALPPPPKPLDFDGSEQFYVDKKAERSYLRVEKLHRPACPNYFTSRGLGRIQRPKKKDEFKRYFSRKFQKRLARPESSTTQLDEERFLETNKLLNQATTENVKNISAWVDLIKFQDQTPLKHVSKTQLAERKMDILNKALTHNPGSDALYETYVNVANQALPSFEVSKIVEKLLSKDPTNYVLWRALILATQGSMARCVVPDVMKLYERAMQQNYRKRQSDEAMLSKWDKFLLIYQ